MAKVATNQERLNQLFNADPRNDSAIADALGVSKQALSAWRNGIRSPKASMVQKIAEMYDTSQEWLYGWDLPAPRILTTIVSATIPPVFKLSDEEKVLILAFRAAPEERKSVIWELLDKYKKED